MTQNEKILAYMKAGNRISPWVAMREFNCMRLASRINDLKRMGHNIKTETVHTRSALNDPIHYSEYWLEAENDGNK